MVWVLRCYCFCVYLCGEKKRSYCRSVRTELCGCSSHLNGSIISGHLWRGVKFYEVSALSILNPGKVAAETGAAKASEHVRCSRVLKNSQLVLVCSTAGSLCAQETKSRNPPETGYLVVIAALTIAMKM